MKKFETSETNLGPRSEGLRLAPGVTTARVMLLFTLLPILISSCGKTESFASANTVKPGKSLDRKPSQPQSPATDPSESTPVDEPQSVAGMYLLECADYIAKADDSNKSQSIGCEISGTKGQGVQLQNFANREWRAKDAQGRDATPSIHEDTTGSSVRIFATHNSGMSSDLSLIEFIFDKKNPAEKLEFRFPNTTKPFSAIGTWSVVRTVPTRTGFTLGGLQILSPQKNLGLVKIEYKPGSTQEFFASVSGSTPIVLDYADRDPSKIAQPGTSLFSGRVNSETNTIPVAAATSQNVIPPDLNKNPTIQINKSADGTIISMRIIVSQPRYGETYWDFTPAK